VRRIELVVPRATLRAMGKPIGAVFVLLGLSAGCIGPAQDDPNRTEIPEEELALRGQQSNVVVGLRSFEDDGFQNMDDQLALAIDYGVPIGLPSLRLEGGLHYSFDETSGELSNGGGEDLETYTIEFSLGPNVSVLAGRFRPYVGVGGSALFVQQRAIDRVADDVVSDNDITWGGYLKAGVLYQFAHTAHIGLEYRRLQAKDVTLNGEDVEGTYDQIALVVGATF